MAPDGIVRWDDTNRRLYTSGTDMPIASGRGSQFLDWRDAQHEPFDAVGSEVDGDDRVPAFVLRLEDGAESETVMRHLVTDMEIVDVKTVVPVKR